MCKSVEVGKMPQVWVCRKWSEDWNMSTADGIENSSGSSTSRSSDYTCKRLDNVLNCSHMLQSHTFLNQFILSKIFV